jgi:hypothetical protein
MYKISIKIVLRLFPCVCFALLIKTAIWFCESESWWPTITNTGMIMGVVGFGIAVLLGSKLSVVNGRLYSIEDAVCRIVGSLRIFVHKNNVSDDVKYWAHNFDKVLSNPAKDRIIEMRVQTNILIKKLVEEGYDGPNLSGFSRDVSYVLHRSTAEIPAAYECFLSMINILYMLTIALTVSGLSGFVIIFIVVFVLMGAALLTDDMDHPFDSNESSLITVNLEPLEQFIEQK